MAGLCTRDFGITADLNRQIDKSNHDANRADDLSEIGQVIEIHVSEPLAVVGQALRLPNQKAASPSRTGIMRLPYNSSLAFELTLVIRRVEISFRFCDEPVGIKFPKFVAADTKAFSGTTWAGVRSR